MLYSVAVMSASKRKTLVRTNSFSLARKAYLSALSNESYETCYSHASMTKKERQAPPFEGGEE